ncbi:MAG: L,D-transpeptidase family protein [Rhodospirillales bacterium]
MLIRVVAESGWHGRLSWPGGQRPCRLGRAGIRVDKREGDGATPAGLHPLRRVLWRDDRLSPPATGLPRQPIRPDDGWCDDPADAAYNRPVTLPYPGRHERLWRDDGLYDVIVVIGHNDDPVVAGAGSAVFIHVVAPDGAPTAGAPTAGCIALALPDLLALLTACRLGDAIDVEAGEK